MSTEKKVDVLAVLAYHVETYKRLNRGAKSHDDHIIDIEEAQAVAEVVAELIEAATDARDTLHSCIDALSSKEQDDHDALDRLDAALARVGGAP